MYRSSRSFFLGGNSYRKNNSSRGKLFYGKKTFVSKNYSYAFKRNKIKFLGKKGIKDDVIKYDEGIADGQVHASYICLPRLGQGAGCRDTDVIRINSINLSGSFRVFTDDTSKAHSMQSDADVQSDGPPTDGVAGSIIVLDRSPDEIQVPNFEDVFGHATGEFDSKMDRLVRVDQLSRFKVMLRHKMIVRNMDDLFPCSKYLKYTGKNVVTTTFRDSSSDRLGNYVNTKKNAFIVYVIWEGDAARKLYCNVNTRITYYH